MDAIRIYPQDNVAVALRDLNKGALLKLVCKGRASSLLV